MPQRNTVQIIINAKDDASAILGGVGGALEGLGKVALGATAAVAAAAVGVGAAITKLAVDAAPLQGVSAAFEGLAQSAGIGADEMLSALERGSAGMIAQGDLMTSFNKAAQLVSVDFAQTLPDAMGSLGKVAAATGEDMGFLLDSLVVGVGRLSPMILDNLGIQVSLTEANQAYADSIGVAVEDLTKQQQQAALTAQVMEKLAENTAAMPDVTGTAAAGLAQMEATIQNVKDQIGLAFIPALQAVLGPILEIAEDVGPQLIEWAELAGEWLGENIPLAIEKFKTFWAETWPIIEEKIRIVWPIIERVFEQIQTWMTQEGPSALSTISNAFQEAWAFIQEQVQKVVVWFEQNLPLIQETGKVLADFFTNNVAPALASAWELIKSVISTALDVILGVIKVAMQVITGDWDGAWQTVKETLVKAVVGLLQSIENFFELIANLVGTTMDDIRETWRSNWEMAVTIVSTVWDNIISAIQGKVAEIKSFLSNQIGAFKQLGASLITGIEQGIQEKVNSIIGAIRNTIQRIIAEALALLDISSPSGVFAEIGRQMALGIGMGFGAAMEGVRWDIENALDLGGLFAGLGSAAAGILRRNVIKPLEEQIELFDDSMETLRTSFEDVHGAFGEFVDLPLEQLQELLRMASDPRGGGPIDFELVRAIQAAIELRNIEQERADAAFEVLEAQQAIAELQRQQQNLAFLQQQVKLLDLIAERGLDASAILDGLTLGIDADALAVTQAMSAAMEEIIRRTEDQLGISSPSRVFEQIGSQLMLGLAQGVRDAEFIPRQAAMAATDAMTQNVSNNTVNMTINTQATTSNVLADVQTARALLGE